MMPARMSFGAEEHISELFRLFSRDIAQSVSLGSRLEQNVTPTENSAEYGSVELNVVDRRHRYHVVVAHEPTPTQKLDRSCSVGELNLRSIYDAKLVDGEQHNDWERDPSRYDGPKHSIEPKKHAVTLAHANFCHLHAAALHALGYMPLCERTLLFLRAPVKGRSRVDRLRSACRLTKRNRTFAGAQP